MFVGSEQIFKVLSQFNRWWSCREGSDLPSWQRASFPELARWVEHPPAARAVLLSGAGQVGKTTMLRQLVKKLWTPLCHPAVSFMVIPFEVEYRGQNHTGPSDLKGLLQFCQERECPRGYVVTRSPQDFGVLRGLSDPLLQIMKVPAPLFWYWMGQAELHESQSGLSI